MKATAFLGGINWYETARAEVDRISETFVSHIWQPRKERPAIVFRPDTTNAPSSRMHCHGPTSAAYKT